MQRKAFMVLSASTILLVGVVLVVASFYYSQSNNFAWTKDEVGSLIESVRRSVREQYDEEISSLPTPILDPDYLAKFDGGSYIAIAKLASSEYNIAKSEFEQMINQQIEQAQGKLNARLRMLNELENELKEASTQEEINSVMSSIQDQEE